MKRLLARLLGRQKSDTPSEPQAPPYDPGKAPDEEQARKAREDAINEQERRRVEGEDTVDPERFTR
jgi:hypothetical protein